MRRRTARKYHDIQFARCRHVSLPQCLPRNDLQILLCRLVPKRRQLSTDNQILLERHIGAECSDFRLSLSSYSAWPRGKGFAAESQLSRRSAISGEGSWLDSAKQCRTGRPQHQKHKITKQFLGSRPRSYAIESCLTCMMQVGKRGIVFQRPLQSAFTEGSFSFAKPRSSRPQLQLGH